MTANARLRQAVISVGAGSTPLPDEVADATRRVEIELHAARPASCEITLRDPDGSLAKKAGLVLGATLTVKAADIDGGRHRTVFTGEVTSFLGRYRGMRADVIVRALSAEHRLQRVRHTRAFVNVRDSDVVGDLVRGAGLKLGQVDRSETTHPHLAQVNETDWEFLTRRAREIGFEVRAVDGAVEFRDAAKAGRDHPIELSWPGRLWRFDARVTSAALPASVEVRTWDPIGRKAVAHRAALDGGAVDIGSDVADTQRLGPRSAPGHSVSRPAVGNLGPAPSGGFLVVDHPVGEGADAAAAAAEVADALARRLGDAFASASGDTIGDPRIVPPVRVRVSGVSPQFEGVWRVTSARHVFDMGEGGYRTYFDVNDGDGPLGGQSIDHERPTRFTSVVMGVVTNVDDPLAIGRVKLALPWLTTDFESDWAPVVQLGAAPTAGGLFLPSVGEQVLVGFEFGDARRPYVLGSVLSQGTKFVVGGGAAVHQGQVQHRGLRTASGNQLAFVDDVPPGADGDIANRSQVLLGSADGAVALLLDQVEGKVAVTCRPEPPKSKNAHGELTIECGNAGVINIKAGPGGRVTVDGGAELSLTATTKVELRSSGVVSIKGQAIELN